MPLDSTAMGPLPEEDAASKRQVNRLHKSRPSDLSYMKRRHHLEWYRFRNYWTPDRRRRRDRVHGLELVVAGTIGPTSASFVDLFDGCFMGNPSIMELARRGRALTKVVVKLSRHAGHDLLEASQLVLEVLQSVMENVYLGVLLTNHLTKVATLTGS